MKLYLIRHAESEANKNKIFAGITDYPLSDNGLKQAEELKDRIISNGIKFDLIFSSPLKRTLQTITPTAKALGIEITKDKNLIEMCVGDWEDLTFDQIYELDAKVCDHIIETDEFVGIPNQETHEEVSNRMYDEILKIINDNPNKDIAIVSHSIAIRSFMCKIFDVPFLKILEIIGKLDNAHIMALEFDENTKHFKILSKNM